ncbi:hypothetical protein c7_R61 [Megavirus courdo7]|uniref:Uncharacterized protein n=1 Tax=Megavirus courdo7 TaxID=1128135 RepID=H2E9Q4_9VIRU|nr:hypothetical protein c7_R61 [Megavirus courdo7]
MIYNYCNNIIKNQIFYLSLCIIIINNNSSYL